MAPDSIVCQGEPFGGHFILEQGGIVGTRCNLEEIFDCSHWTNRVRTQGWYFKNYDRFPVLDGFGPLY